MKLHKKVDPIERHEYHQSIDELELSTWQEPNLSFMHAEKQKEIIMFGVRECATICVHVYILQSHCR